jgi:dynein heavy chain
MNSEVAKVSMVGTKTLPKFGEWSKRLVNTEYDPTQSSMGNVFVPTIETLATSEFIKSFINIKHPSLVIGMAGCGKT